MTNPSPDYCFFQTATQISEFEIPMPGMRSEEEQQTVVAVSLCNANGNQIARAVIWPEPLKYAFLPKPKDVKLKLAPNVRDLNRVHALDTGGDLKPPHSAGDRGLL